MENHLFLFTISPVQSFIAQARKTQDLYAGSRILSDLIKCACIEISKKNGQVIFPAKNTGESMSNRVLAKFELPENTDLKILGTEIANVVDSEIKKWIEKAKSEIGSEYKLIEDSFEKQLENYFSTYWVFVEIKNENYLEASYEAERLLGAVKNVRTYTQNPEKGRKCSLSGEQNALVFAKSNKKLPAFTDNVVQVETDKLNEGEGLSAISFIKRSYPFDKSKKQFDSTADIALLHCLQKLNEIQSKGTNLFLDCFAKCFSKNKIEEVDGQLLFEENFTSKYFDKHNYNPNLLEQAKLKFADIKKVAKKENIPFTKYYAILLFDADSMGAWLSGEYLTDKAKLEEFHTHLSGLMSDFAEYAQKYVDGLGTDKTKKGRTVYAGGDDYLGFINLHYLFEVLKHLREQFEVLISQKLSDNGKYKLKKTDMTFSAGIAIAHYKTPLSEVLSWARKMEKEAKNFESDKKDKFGIAVLKKSGEIHKTVLPFKDSTKVYFTDKVQAIVNYLSDEKYSSKFITNLERELSLFDGDFEYRNRILKSESLRLIENSRNKQKTEKTENAKLMEILDEIRNSTKDITSNYFHTSLGICDFINRKLQGND